MDDGAVTDNDLRKVLEVLAGCAEITSRLLLYAHGCKPEAMTAAAQLGLADGRVMALANPKIEVVYLRITEAGRAWLAR